MSMHGSTWPKNDKASRLDLSVSGPLTPRRGKNLTLSPLALRSTSRANPNALEESTWLVRSCQLKSINHGDCWGGTPPPSHSSSKRTPTRGLPSMAVIRAATCPFHTLHPSQHKETRAELVRWCLEGDNSGNGVILYPEVMPKHLREPLARQEQEMQQCPFCQQCIARCKVLKQEDDEARAQQKMRRRREKQLHELQKAMAMESINGSRLENAVKAWEFEKDNADFLAAVAVVEAYQQAAHNMQLLISDRPVRLAELYAAVIAWRFAEGPCIALVEARKLLSKYEDSVRTAVASSDGWALHKLWQGLHNALGTDGQDLAVEAAVLHARYIDETSEVRGLIASASNMAAEAQDAIARHCHSWSFAKDDPTFALARAWLRVQQHVAKYFTDDVHLAVTSGTAIEVRSALTRRQALSLESDLIGGAEAMLNDFDCACQAAGAISFGRTFAPVPVPGAPFAVVKKVAAELEQAMNEIAAHNFQELDVASEFHVWGVMGIISVIMHLLVGIAPAAKVLLGCTSNSLPSLASARQMFHDPNFLVYLTMVTTRISMGCNNCVISAREAFDSFKTQLLDDWCEEMLTKQSRIAGALFRFAACTFAYDEAVQRTMRVRAPSIGEEPLALQLDVARQLLHAGLGQSRAIAVSWIVCRGDSKEIRMAVSKAQRHAGSVRRMLADTTRKLADAAGLLDDASLPFQEQAIDQSFDRSKSDRDGRLSLTIQQSDNILGTVFVSKEATGVMLKRLIANVLQAPPVVEQSLYCLGKLVHNHVPLWEQRIVDGDVVNLVQETAKLPLLQRLGQCEKAVQSEKLDTVEPALKVAAELCGVEMNDAAEFHIAARGVLDSMVDVLRQAAQVVKDAVSWRRPPCTNVRFCERLQRAEPTNYDLPMGNLTEAVRILRDIPEDSHMMDTVMEFVRAMRYFYEMFLPTYIEWGAAAIADDEAAIAVRRAEEIYELIEVRGISPLAYAPLAYEVEAVAPDNRLEAVRSAIAANFERVAILGKEGIAVVTPFVEHVRCLTAGYLDALFGRVAIATPREGLDLVKSLFATYFVQIDCLRDALMDIAEHFDCNSAMDSFSRMQDGRVLPASTMQLFWAISLIVNNQSEQAMDCENILQQLTDAHSLKQQLSHWCPLRDGSGTQLEQVVEILLRLWGIFGLASCDNLFLQQLYAWAVLAGSLSSALSAAQELNSLRVMLQHTILDFEDAHGKWLEHEEENAWVKVRLGLYRPEEPWGWLGLMGCDSPRLFYLCHGLEPEGKLAGGAAVTIGRALSGMPAAGKDMSPAEIAARKKVEEAAQLRAEAEERLKAREEEELRIRADREAKLKAEEQERLRNEEARRMECEEERRIKDREDARQRAEEAERRASVTAKAAAVAREAVSNRSKMECLELFFAAPFDKIDHDLFTTSLLEGFRVLGASEYVVSSLEIKLRPGSVVAEIRGPPSAIGELKALELPKLKVLDYDAKLSASSLIGGRSSLESASSGKSRLQAVKEARLRAMREENNATREEENDSDNDNDDEVRTRTPVEQANRTDEPISTALEHQDAVKQPSHGNEGLQDSKEEYPAAEKDAFKLLESTQKESVFPHVETWESKAESSAEKTPQQPEEGESKFSELEKDEESKLLVLDSSERSHKDRFDGEDAKSNTSLGIAGCKKVEAFAFTGRVTENPELKSSIVEEGDTLEEAKSMDSSSSQGKSVLDGFADVDIEDEEVRLANAQKPTLEDPTSLQAMEEEEEYLAEEAQALMVRSREEHLGRQVAVEVEASASTETKKTVREEENASESEDTQADSFRSNLPENENWAVDEARISLTAQQANDVTLEETQPGIAPSPFGHSQAPLSSLPSTISVSPASESSWKAVKTLQQAKDIILEEDGVSAEATPKVMGESMREKRLIGESPDNDEKREEEKTRVGADEEKKYEAERSKSPTQQVESFVRSFVREFFGEAICEASENGSSCGKAEVQETQDANLVAIDDKFLLEIREARKQTEDLALHALEPLQAVEMPQLAKDVMSEEGGVSAEAKSKATQDSTQEKRGIGDSPDNEEEGEEVKKHLEADAETTYEAARSKSPAQHVVSFIRSFVREFFGEAVCEASENGGSCRKIEDQEAQDSNLIAIEDKFLLDIRQARKQAEDLALQALKPLQAVEMPQLAKDIMLDEDDVSVEAESKAMEESTREKRKTGESPDTDEEGEDEKEHVEADEEKEDESARSRSPAEQAESFVRSFVRESFGDAICEASENCSSCGKAEAQEAQDANLVAIDDKFLLEIRQARKQAEDLALHALEPLQAVEMPQLAKDIMLEEARSKATEESVQEKRGIGDSPKNDEEGEEEEERLEAGEEKEDEAARSKSPAQQVESFVRSFVRESFGEAICDGSENGSSCRKVEARSAQDTTLNAIEDKFLLAIRQARKQAEDLALQALEPLQAVEMPRLAKDIMLEEDRVSAEAKSKAMEDSAVEKRRIGESPDNDVGSKKFPMEGSRPIEDLRMQALGEGCVRGHPEDVRVETSPNALAEDSVVDKLPSKAMGDVKEGESYQKSQVVAFDDETAQRRKKVLASRSTDSIQAQRMSEKNHLNANRVAQLRMQEDADRMAVEAQRIRAESALRLGDGSTTEEQLQVQLETTLADVAAATAAAAAATMAMFEREERRKITGRRSSQASSMGDQEAPRLPSPNFQKEEQLGMVFQDPASTASDTQLQEKEATMATITPSTVNYTEVPETQLDSKLHKIKTCNIRGNRKQRVHRMLSLLWVNECKVTGTNPVWLLVGSVYTALTLSWFILANKYGCTPFD